MTRLRIDRRQVLAVLGVGSMLAPFVPLLEAEADPGPAPRRIVFFFSANGTIRESWLPTVDADGLRLSPILAPLEHHRSRLLVVDGLAHKAILEKSKAPGHTAGMNTALTGRTNELTDPSRPDRSLASGISVDQHLAERLASGTRFKTIELGVQVEPFSKDFAAISYRGRLQPVLPENSPYAAFDRLFGDLGAARAGQDRAGRAAREDRLRLLELASLELDELTPTLSRSDRTKMEAHLDSLRALKHTLATGVGAAVLPTCAPPELGKSPELWANESIPALAKLQIDLLVAALACDLTRIGTLQIGRGGCAHRMTWLGPEFERDPLVNAASMAKGFHAIAHHESDPVQRAKLVKIHTWYAAQLAYLLDRLGSVPEGGGTLLDNTAVVWVNELGTGGTHSHEFVPFLVAGGLGGRLRTGQLVSFPGEPHNRLLLSLCHAMGVEDPTFGDPDYCGAGPLTGIAT